MTQSYSGKRTASPGSVGNSESILFHELPGMCDMYMHVFCYIYSCVYHMTQSHRGESTRQALAASVTAKAFQFASCLVRTYVCIYTHVFL